LVSEKKIPHTKSQSHKENNHRAHREHRESFSAFVFFFRKPSEKHECFSEGLLKKEKPGGETAGGLPKGQSLAEKY
jgi:G3E family GTPase